MRSQKHVLHSKTIWSALITLAMAIGPTALEGIEDGFTPGRLLQIGAIFLTTAGTIAGRYTAKGDIYTPHGIPGRNYISATSQNYDSEFH